MNKKRWIFRFLILIPLLINVVLFWNNPFDFDKFLINVLLGLSVFVTLHTGLLSLASTGFMAIGAYTSAGLVAKLGLPLFVSLPVAMILCAAIAFVLSIPVLRLKDVYLAIATLGFGEVVRILIVLNPDWTGGATGANLSTGYAFETMHQTQTWMLLLACFTAFYFFYRIQQSKTGSALRAIRHNAPTAESFGINSEYYKTWSFIVSAVIAGAAGVFYAHAIGSLDNGDFRFTREVDVLSYAVLGGSYHWFGPVLGAGLLTSLPLFLRDTLEQWGDLGKYFHQLPMILDGLALILIVVFRPGGLYQPKRFVHRYKFDTNRSEPSSSFSKPELFDQDKNLPGDSLVLKDISLSFAGLKALDRVHLELKPGVFHGLIGPNGAGKTTLVNVITGLVPAQSGSMIWKGQESKGKKAYQRARQGIARTFQHIHLFPDMSVLDNVVLGAHRHLKSSLSAALLFLLQERHERNAAKRRALEILENLGLAHLAFEKASRLSYGNQRRVEIARALMLEPQLLLLDEPAAGMNPSETNELLEFLKTLRARGLTILMIEHHIDFVKQLCDHVFVLNFGQILVEGTGDAVTKDPRVVEAYLGKDEDHAASS